jgi:hypothetical protein
MEDGLILAVLDVNPTQQRQSSALHGCQGEGEWVEEGVKPGIRNGIPFSPCPSSPH